MKYSMLAIPILLLSSCISAARGPEIQVSGGRSFYAADSGTQATNARVAYLTRESETTGIRGVAAVSYEQGSVQAGAGTVDRVELDLGLRGRVWGPFYLGLGAAPTFVHGSSAGHGADNGFLCGYGEVGAEWNLSQHITTGIVYRHTLGASASLGSGPRENLNEGTLSATVGWGF